AGPGEAPGSAGAALTVGDCTLGVTGLGGIGPEPARRGLAFGMRVLGVDPRAAGAPDGVTLWRPDRLDELLAASDFVVVAAPHTPETYKLMNLARFQRMKRTAYFINVGRGVVVDLADLTAPVR